MGQRVNKEAATTSMMGRYIEQGKPLAGHTPETAFRKWQE